MIRCLLRSQTLYTSFRKFSTTPLAFDAPAVSRPKHTIRGLVTARRILTASSLGLGAYVAATVHSVDDARLLWLIPTRLARDVWTAAATVAGEGTTLNHKM